MLFNSYSFLLVFLPVTLIGYFVFGRSGKGVGAAWLACCSLCFYSWWDYRYLLLLLASICLNYLAGSYISRHHNSGAARQMLTFAVFCNLALLGYYKYADFFIGSVNAAFGADWAILGLFYRLASHFLRSPRSLFLQMLIPVK